MVYLIIPLTIPKKIQAADDVKFNPQVSIPDSQFQRVECPPGTSKEKCEELKYTITGKTIGEYIQAIYNYAIGIVGILAAVVLMFGGVIWLTAGGSPERVKEAKAWIGASISGLILVLCSYMILNTINPDLVSFKEIAPEIVPKSKLKLEDITCEYYTDEQNCKYSAGCKWEDGKCILDTGYAKCGLTEEEKVGPFRCCEKKLTADTYEYKYALIPLNQSCVDVCEGGGWVKVDNNKCETKLGY